MSTLYREWIEALKVKNWKAVSDEKLKLELGKWSWMVLVKFEKKDNKWLPQQALVKVVGLVDSQSDEWNKLIQPDLSQTPLNATSDYVFDPFGVAVLRGGEGKKESVLLENLGLLPTDQLFVQTYSWKISEKRWNLVGSLPLVPPMEVGGICWDGKYLDDYYLSAVKFPDAMEGVLIATLRLGIVVGEYEWDNRNNQWRCREGLNNNFNISISGGNITITLGSILSNRNMGSVSLTVTNPKNKEIEFRLYLFTTP